MGASDTTDPPMSPPGPGGDSRSFAAYAIFLTALAGGMGWGIRGQYGHESGAMVAGVLTSLTLVMLFAPHLTPLNGLRAAAMMTVAIGLGGSMTYGQTVGLTHDPELIGHWGALRWGMLGLFLKGGLWIGFAAMALGMGLGGIRYRATEITLLLALLCALTFIGMAWLNAPFEPEQKRLPWIYFSDHWQFEPNGDLHPRREIWGGLLLALLTLATYVRWIRTDRLAARMAVIGFLAGGLGFSGAQCVQAFRRWSPDIFTEGALAPFAGVLQHVNWWNTMETIFGMIFGGGLALGLWMNRKLIQANSESPPTALPPLAEMGMIAAHLALLLLATFVDFSPPFDLIDLYVDHGILMAVLPLIGVVGGRWWPAFLLFPVAAAPIAGKTLRQVSYRSDLITPEIGWLLLIALPLSFATAGAIWFTGLCQPHRSARTLAARCLLPTIWLYFGLNTVFFQFAWPWTEPWTMRTPHQTIFGLFAVTLTVAAILHSVGRSWPPLLRRH